MSFGTSTNMSPRCRTGDSTHERHLRNCTIGTTHAEPVAQRMMRASHVTCMKVTRAGKNARQGGVISPAVRMVMKCRSPVMTATFDDSRRPLRSERPESYSKRCCNASVRPWCKYSFRSPYPYPYPYSYSYSYYYGASCCADTDGTGCAIVRNFHFNLSTSSYRKNLSQCCHQVVVCRSVFYIQKMTGFFYYLEFAF